MASTAHSAQVHGTGEVDLMVANKNYDHFRLEVMNHLCADVILGMDFIKMRNEVQFNLRGPNTPLRIDTGSAITSKTLLVMAAKVESPRIFRSLEIGFSFFPDIQLPGKRKIFKKIPGTPGKFLGFSGFG